jgi:hypothetical protein
MPIQTVCQGCQRTLRVPDEHAGRKARCPQCQTIFRVPDASQAETPAPQTDTPATNQFHPVASSIPAAGPLASSYPSHAPEVRWRVRLSDGREYGPVSRQELDSWYQQNRLTPDSQIQQEGNASWLPATTLYPALARPSAFPVAPAPNPPNPFGKNLPSGANPFGDQPSSPYGGSAYPNPYAASPYGPQTTYHLPPNRGGTVLVLAILGFLFCCVLNIVAIFMALEDKKQIAAGRMSAENEGLLTAGLIVSIIPLALAALWLVIVLIAMIVQGP